MFPSFLTNCVSLNNLDIDKVHSKRLVIIQLSGGNDGLNTIIPYNEDLYLSSRPKIKIKNDIIRKTTPSLGFHPSLKTFENLFEKNELLVINNVGYPNASRSHFRSLDVWHSARTDLNRMNSGWIGRYLDNTCNGIGAIEVDDTLSLALKGENCNGFSFSSFAKLSQAKNPINKEKSRNAENEKLAFLYKTMAKNNQFADVILEKAKYHKSTISYPDTNFANDLKLISQLITTDLDTKIYYASLGGFDTHAKQKNKQSKLLKTLDEALYSFIADLKSHRLYENVSILIFSEFGRRLKENNSLGTDHGKANNSFIINPSLKSTQFYNSGPNLKDLDAGDVKFDIDFRQIYSTLLEDWLEVDSVPILSKKYEKLTIFN